MSRSTTRPRTQGSLPWWVWGVLVFGGLLGVLGLVLMVAPVVFMLWGMGNGPQYDTRLLVGADSVAVVHADGDLDDPGMADLAVAIGDIMPALEKRRRLDQGAPEIVAEMSSARRSVQFAGEQPIAMPRQITLVVDRRDDASDDAVLVATNPYALGRMLDALFSVVTRLIPTDGAHAAPETIEVAGERLFVRTRHSDPEDFFFFGTLDSTLMAGEAGPAYVRRAMESLLEGQVSAGPLHGLVATIEPDGWDLWGGTRLDDAALSKLPAPDGEPLCLGDLSRASHPGVAFGLDVRSADELSGELFAPVQPGTSLQPATSCLTRLGIQAQEAGAAWGLSVRWEVAERDGGVVAYVDVTGLEAAMVEWAYEMESAG